jgi:SOS-response transcriptional repressor LexA
MTIERPQAGLTCRQMDAMRFIQGHVAAKGYSPNYREIMAGIGARSTSIIFRLVNALVERGYLWKDRKVYGYQELIILRPVSIPRIGRVPLQYIPLEAI